jgi:large subunit ribosomal protein L4
MAQLSVIGGGQVTVSDDVFSVDFNQALVHQVVVAFRANGRLGTRKQKTRSEVIKSTRKPWRQKGTGRARAGMASSPIWRGGGRAFPSLTTENFFQKINKKMYRGAMRSVFSRLHKEERICLVKKEFFDLEFPKTKLAVQKLASSSLAGRSVLFVLDVASFDEKFYMAARNIYDVAFVSVDDVNPLALMFFDLIVCSEQAVREIEERFNG